MKYYIFYSNYGGGHGESTRESHVLEVEEKEIAGKIYELRKEMATVHAIVYGLRMDKYRGKGI